MRFFNLFLAYMVEKYQNEILPIFHYGKSLKTNKKYLKIPDLHVLTLGCIKGPQILKWASAEQEEDEIVCRRKD